jgi:hypothetical protein
MLAERLSSLRRTHEGGRRRSVRLQRARQSLAGALLRVEAEEDQGCKGV